MVGDFNEELDVSYDGLMKLASDFDLTDVMFHIIGDDDFPTYDRGSTRVDYALADGWGAETIINTCYEPFQFRSKGVHRPMIFDFDAQRLFGNPTYRLMTQAQREFTAKDTSCNRKYIENRHEYLTLHNFDARMKRLQAH